MNTNDKKLHDLMFHNADYYNAKIINQHGEELLYHVVVDMMDDEIREMLHGAKDYTDQQFFDDYCAEHKKHFGEEFYCNT